MAEIIDLFQHRAAQAAHKGLNTSQSETLAACEKVIAETRALLDTLTFNDPSLKKYFATRDDMGWGTQYLTRMSKGADRYGGDWNDISMCWGVYLAQQRLVRLEREIKLIRKDAAAGTAQAPPMECFTLPREETIYANATACPRHAATMAKILSLTAGAIHKLTGLPEGRKPPSRAPAPG